MRIRISTAALFSVLWVAACELRTRGDEPSQHSPNARLLAIIDFILQEHIDPPTRQQMVLNGVKSLYESSTNRPRELSKRISQLASDEQFIAFLNEIREDLGKDAQAEIDATFLNGVLASLPGGGLLLSKDEARVQEQLSANRYVGIGIALSMKDGLPLISKLFYDGPGDKAGVESEDLMVEINGIPCDGKDLTTIVQELRGEEGTDVTLLLKREGEPDREITVTRGVTFIPTVEGTREVSPGRWQYTSESNPRIAVLKIGSVGPSTVHELAKIEAELRDQDLKGIVLDLRSSGGTLHDIILVADHLLEKGIIGHVQSLDARITHEAHPGSLFTDVPLAVLIASQSGAGPAFLTAALQDQGRAFVVGQPMIGDAFVRSRLELPSGERLQLATATLQRGNGITLLPRASDPQLVLRAEANKPVALDKRSVVVPDVVVEPSPDDLAVQRAIELLTVKPGEASN